MDQQAILPTLALALGWEGSISNTRSIQQLSSCYLMFSLAFSSFFSHLTCSCLNTVHTIYQTLGATY